MELKEYHLFVLKPTLAHLQLGSEAAERLLLSTIAHETQGIHLDQRLSKDDSTLGPAFGIFQIEPATHADLYANFLNFPNRAQHKKMLTNLRAGWPEPMHQLVTNLAYATGVARFIYYRDSQPLPEPHDTDGLWKYYKRVFNTPSGAATKKGWMHWYKKLVLPLYPYVPKPTITSSDNDIDIGNSND